jgi:hypothetical protein
MRTMGESRKGRTKLKEENKGIFCLTQHRFSAQLHHNKLEAWTPVPPRKNAEAKEEKSRNERVGNFSQFISAS